MRLKTYFSLGIVVALAVLVIAQTGGLGGSGGSLGIPTSPLVTDHAFKNCKLNNQDVTIKYNVTAMNMTARSFRWNGVAIFHNLKENCVANLGTWPITYTSKQIPKEELGKSIKRAYLDEYNKERLARGSGNIRGNYTK